MPTTWDQRYSSENYVYGTKPNEWFAEKLHIIKPGMLLMPAEGEGRNAVWAAEQGWQVTAFDQSTEGRTKALNLAAEREVEIEYHVKDLRCYRDDEEKYDAIGLIYVHMPPEYRYKVHEELIKLLKPGGSLILEAFSKAQLGNTSGGPKMEELLYDPIELKNDFQDLKILEFYNVRLHLEEGQQHQGIADVIRIFARKK